MSPESGLTTTSTPSAVWTPELTPAPQIPVTTPPAESAPAPQQAMAETHDDGPLQETIAHMIGGMNLVRLEVFMTPEQTQALMRTVLTGNKTVWTSREVAQYLRLTAPAVEKMAFEGNLPGFKVGESWRFLKSSIDDWMHAQGLHSESGSDEVA